GWWPARIAETAMFLVDHQANQELAERIGQAPYRLPIKITAHIIHSNALPLNWNLAIPEDSGQTYVFGNPPFIGQGEKSRAQAEEMQVVWGKDYACDLDYVTAWHKQSMELLEDRDGELAFVATNSITQGSQVSLLFGPFFNSGWKIKFAHRTFEWDSQAPGKAAVHCVIVGFTRNKDARPRFFDYENVRSEAHEVRVSNINPYLVDAPNFLVQKATRPISPIVPPVVRGSQPTDDGHLVPKAGTPRPVQDPIAMKYVRRFIGARELLYNIPRWCIWTEDEDFEPSDISRSPVLHKHIEACRAFRQNSSETGDAYKLRMTQHRCRPLT